MSNLKRKHESSKESLSKASGNLLEGKFLGNSWNPIQETTIVLYVDFKAKMLVDRITVENETK